MTSLGKFLADTADTALRSVLAKLVTLDPGGTDYEAGVYHALMFARDAGYRTGVVALPVGEGKIALWATILLPCGDIAFRLPMTERMLEIPSDSTQRQRIFDYCAMRNDTQTQDIQPNDLHCERCVHGSVPGTYVCISPWCECHTRIEG